MASHHLRQLDSAGVAWTRSGTSATAVFRAAAVGTAAVTANVQRARAQRHDAVHGPTRRVPRPHRDSGPGRTRTPVLDNRVPAGDGDRSMPAGRVQGSCTCALVFDGSGVPGGRHDERADGLRLLVQRRPAADEARRRLPVDLASLVAPGPPGWTRQAPTRGRGPRRVHGKGDITSPRNDRHRFVEGGPGSAGPGWSADPSLDVCLAAFGDPRRGPGRGRTDLGVVGGANRSVIRPSDSVPIRATVPGVPGAVSFLDLSPRPGEHRLRQGQVPGLRGDDLCQPRWRRRATQGSPWRVASTPRSPDQPIRRSTAPPPGGQGPESPSSGRGRCRPATCSVRLRTRSLNASPGPMWSHRAGGQWVTYIVRRRPAPVGRGRRA